MSKAWFLMGGVALLALGAAAAPARAETLDEVLATTYAGNPSLAAQRAKLRATDESVPKALSGWRPTVTVNASAGHGTYMSNSNESRYEAARSPRSAGVTATQSLYSGGRTVAETAQAENTVLAERAQLAATEQTVLLSSITAYINVVHDTEVLNLSINNEQVLRRQLEATQERFRVGEVTRTDVSQAEARLAKAVADRIGAEGNLQSSRANYVNVVGRPPESPTQPATPQGLPGSLDELTAQALAANPSVLAADHSLAAARDGVDLVFGELLPSVSVTADASRSLDTATISAAQDSAGSQKQVMLNLSVPLYEGGGTHARVRAAKHTAGQRRIEADKTRRDVVESATTAWESLQSARAQLRSYESQIKAADLALAGVREESKVGSRTVLDVLNAEQELFDARVNMVKAQHDVVQAAFQVRAAAGSLTAQGLGLAVDLYDPTRHYDDVRGQWFGTGVETIKGYE